MRANIRCFILFTILLGCGSQNRFNHIERDGFLMDTVIRISLYDTRSEKTLQDLADQVFSYMLSIEKEVSMHMKSSDPERLMETAGKDTMISINDDTENVLKTALAIAYQTHGAFDVTIGPLKEIWGFENGDYRVPDTSEVNTYLRLGNFKNIKLESHKACITSPGLGIDLGGIAKGYILDKAVQWLENNGVKAGLVEAGGDLRVFGPHPNHVSWRIGIQDPRKERGSLVGVIAVKDQSVATSGDYERFFIKDGVRYHHILDPKTGFPSHNAVSVTIIAPQAILADAYATAVFVMGPEKGIALLNQLPDIEGLVIYDDAGKLSHAMSKGAEKMIILE